MGTTVSKPIDLIIQNILETRLQNIERSVIEQAKLRMIDTIGCLIGGAIDPGNPELVRLLREQGGKADASVFIYGDKLPVGNAAMANCILCRSFDFEPVSPVVDGKLVPGHISGTTVMTALTLAQFKELNGRDTLTAMLVGEDLIARVLAASGFDINLGWDGNGTVNALGATVIAGKIFGLDAGQLRHALGLVVSQMGGTMQNIWDGTPAFKLPQGLSARNGIFSAQLALAGWTGPKDALLGPNGYYALYTSSGVNEGVLTKDLGIHYYSDRAIKPYPSCRATHDVIDCAITMKKDHALKAEDIQEVVVYQAGHSLNNFCGKPLLIEDFPHAQLAFSYQYTAAIAFYFGSVLPDHFAEAVFGDPQVIDFVNKVSLVPWQQIDTKEMGIKVLLKNGTELFSPYTGAKGDFIDAPLSEETFRAKFMGNVNYSKKLPIDAAERIFQLVLKIEDLDRLDELFRLLNAGN